MSVTFFGGRARRPWPEMACVSQVFSAQTLAALRSGVRGKSLSEHFQEVSEKNGNLEHIVARIGPGDKWNLTGSKRDGNESDDTSDLEETTIGEDDKLWCSLYNALSNEVALFFKHVGVPRNEGNRKHVNGDIIVWQRVEAETDWHFDNDDTFGRALVVQLTDNSPHTVFDFSEKNSERCASEDRIPEYVCGRNGSVGQGVYFSNVTCHRAPSGKEHDFAKSPRIVFVARGDVDEHTPEDEFTRAAAYNL